MNRRKFIENTSYIGTTLLVPWDKLNIDLKPKYKLGYQLFSIRDHMASDPIGTLKSLKAMGYEDFEVYGFDEVQSSYYGMKPRAFKNVLDDFELTVTSGHYGFAPHFDDSQEDLMKFVDLCIGGALEIDSRYITWPWIAPEQRTIENFKKMPSILNKIGERVRAAGLGFAYHNHGFEFEDHNGETVFDIIVKETDPDLVKLQIDMYWVMNAGATTPKKLIEEQPGRYVMWHIKDMDSVTRDYTELGNGSINYKNVLPDPVTSGLEYLYIEQGGNFAEDSMKSAEKSAIYFKKHLRDQL